MNTHFRLIIAALCLILFMPLHSFSQQKGPRLEFVKEVEDLGRILAEDIETTSLKVEFTNSGDQPLVISGARGCCGTRIIDWTKTPILPGEKGVVNVEFRLPPRAHAVSRTVSVLSNDPDGMKVFRIRGEVVESGAALQLSPAGPRAQ